MSHFATTRRGFLGAAAGSAALAASRPAGAAGGVTIGMIYVGSKDDFGWNQAHAVGAKALTSIPGVTIVEEERVPENGAVMKTMQSMIDIDGAKLLLPTSFGYFNPFMIEAARKYPDIEFRHPTSLWDRSKHPMNLGGYFCYLDQAHYVNGVAAGLSTKANKIGYVAAKPIAIVLRNINAFTLGVKRVNPRATVQLVMTGDWSLPVREAEATNALIDSGCDVIACHVDSPKICIQTAEGRGAKTCGHNADLSSLAPRGFITGAELKWGTVYKQFAALIVRGETLPNVNEGGYDRDMVQSTRFGAGATEEARVAAAKAIADVRGGAPIFIGPLRDNRGNQVVSGTLGLYDPALWTMNYLLEGVSGSII